MSNSIQHKGYIIEANMTGYVNYEFHKKDDERILGDGKSIEDCQNQIDELINE